MKNSLIIRVTIVTVFITAIILWGFSAFLADSEVASQTVVAQTTTANTQQAFDQEKKLAELNKLIEGKENQPAEQVWKNIQQFKGVPAGRILRIMNAYTRALGVSCTHCHVVDQWEKEDKPTKQIARDMTKMVGTINNELLKNIKNLKSQNPSVSCSTCHRGQTKPDTNLPEAKAKS